MLTYRFPEALKSKDRSYMAERSKDEDARSVCKDQQTDPIQTGFTGIAEAGEKEAETEGRKAVTQERKVLEGEGKAGVTAQAQ